MTQQKLYEYSVQHDQASQTVSQLRDQVRRSQEQLQFIGDSKEFHDPGSSSSSGNTHVPRKSLITSSCRRLSREYMEPHLETFLLAHLFDQNLKNYVMQEIWRHHRGCTRTELRKVRMEKWRPEYQCIACLGERERKVVTVEIVHCFTTLRVILKVA